MYHTQPYPLKPMPVGGDKVVGEVHYHDFHFEISTIDGTDLQKKVEMEILPMMIAELEDNRRSAARRMADALDRAPS
jgi:hypothetical protein